MEKRDQKSISFIPIELDKIERISREEGENEMKT